MAATKTVHLDDFAKEIKGYTDGSIEDIRNATIAGLMKSIPKLVETSPVDTGLYAQSWDTLLTSDAAIIGNYAPYSGVIENGSMPFTPPIKPLLEWAKRVLKDPSQPPNYSSDVWQLAVGVQKKIAKEGMKPRHVMQNALPHMIDNIKEELRKVK